MTERYFSGKSETFWNKHRLNQAVREDELNRLNVGPNGVLTCTTASDVMHKVYYNDGKATEPTPYELLTDREKDVWDAAPWVAACTPKILK